MQKGDEDGQGDDADDGNDESLTFSRAAVGVKPSYPVSVQWLC